MESFHQNELVQFAERVKTSDVVVLGEIHGVKENVDVLTSVVNSLHEISSRPLVLAFEWAIDSQVVTQLNQYIHTEIDVFPESIFFSDSDGRFTSEHRRFLDELREHQSLNFIAIAIFDGESSDNHEGFMAENLLSVQRSNPNALIITSAGVIHARKSAYRDIDGKEVIPMVSYLSTHLKVTSVFLRYLHGEIIVEGKKFSITDAASQIEGPGNAFDYEIIVEAATPCS